MKRLRVWRSAAQPPDETDHFSGEVRIQELNAARGEGEIEVLAVFFGPGVRTVPHTHETDQLLYFVAGEGVVGNAKERRLFRAGEMAVIPAGEWHWHGATPTSEMCHLSIRPAGTSSWPPDVPIGDWDTYMEGVQVDPGDSSRED